MKAYFVFSDIGHIDIEFFFFVGRLIVISKMEKFVLILEDICVIIIVLILEVSECRHFI